MVNNVFAYEFTIPCKLVCKCGILPSSHQGGVLFTITSLWLVFGEGDNILIKPAILSY